MAVWWWAKGDPTTVSIRQRERIISIRTTTQPRSSDGGAEDRSGAALATETPFGSDRPDPYAELDEQGQGEENTSALPAWTLPQVATVLAGAGAAATSTLIGGRLGVAGTVIGAAVASIVANLALNLYDNALKRASHQLRTVVGRKLGRDGSSDPSTATAVQESTGSSPAEPWRRRPMTRKVLRWTLVTALASTLLGLGLMVGIERGTATQITPGTSQLAGTAERSATGTDRSTDRSGTTGQSEVQTDTEVVAPSVAPTGEETIVPTEVPTPGAADGTGTDGDTTTADDSTTTDGSTTDSGTTGDGTTSGGTSDGTTDGGTTSSGTTSGGSGTTSDGTGDTSGTTP